MNSHPIADAYKFCPLCAAASDAVGEQPFKCKQCGFANFFGPVAAVGGLIVDHMGKLLLVRRAREPGKGKWGLPGGFVDAGETVEEAAIREIVEETQLEVTSAKYLFSHPNTYDYLGFISPVIDFFFVCEVKSHTSIKLAAEELEHFEWAHPTPEYLENMAFHSNRLAIEYWLNKATGH